MEVVVQGTEVKVGFSSRVLLKIAQSTFSSMPPGAMNPVAAAQLGKVVDINFEQYRKELFGA